MQKSSFMFAAALAVMSAPASALAVPHVPDVSSITLTVAASDFATEAGTERIMREVRSAAHTLCKEEFSSDDGDLFTRECELSALDDARAQLDKLRAPSLATFSAALVIVRAR
jgi:UrcA family protein